MSFWTDFNILVEKALDEGKSVVIVGDINEDQLNSNNKHLNNICLLNNLNNIIKEPTRVTDTTATLIDPILVTDSIKTINSGTLEIPNGISDHKATYYYIPFFYHTSCNIKRRV